MVEGPPDSPYAGGYYHGVLTFPRDYPFRPPSIRMLTPNGRFQTNFRYLIYIFNLDFTFICEFILDLALFPLKSKNTKIDIFRFRLCLSISDYHPDTWNPAWTVSTILTGLLSFMVALIESCCFYLKFNI